MEESVERINTTLTLTRRITSSVPLMLRMGMYVHVIVILMDACVHGCMHGCMDGCMDACMDACIDGWMDGCMVGAEECWDGLPCECKRGVLYLSMDSYVCTS